MPEVEEKLDFQKIMEIGADSLGGVVASAIVAQLFGEKNDTQALITHAIEEICKRLTKVIDNAFMQEYIADTNSIASRLLAYQETNDLNILDEIFADASNTVHRLRRFDTIESITSCNYISTLHLVATKALAEHNPQYNETLKRLGKEYADWSQSSAQRLIDHTNVSVTEPFPNMSLYVEIRNDYDYKIIEGSDATDINQIVFKSLYKDNWAPAGREALRWVESEPINVLKSLCRHESIFSFSQLELTESGKKDPVLRNELRELNEKAQQAAKDFLGMRLDASNAMKESILYACNSWHAL